MRDERMQALELVDDLYDRNRLTSEEHLLLHDELDEMETLRDRDEVLEELWNRFSDVPMNPETEEIEEPFLGWGVGISREEIWHWFDQRYSKGIVGLLYPGSDAREADRLYKIKQSCIDCESSDCAFNKLGVCRFPMVHDRQPTITEDDGCSEFCIRNLFE